MLYTRSATLLGIAVLLAFASCKKKDADDINPNDTSQKGPILVASTGWETLASFPRHSGQGINVFNTMSGRAIGDAGQGKIGFLIEESAQYQQSTIYTRYKALYVAGQDTLPWQPLAFIEPTYDNFSSNTSVGYNYGFVPGSYQATQAYLKSTQSGGFANYEMTVKGDGLDNAPNVNVTLSGNNPDYLGIPVMISPTEILLSGTKIGGGFNGNYTNSFYNYRKQGGGWQYNILTRFQGYGYSVGHRAFVMGDSVFSFLQDNNRLKVGHLPEAGNGPVPELAGMDTAGIGDLVITYAKVVGNKVVLTMIGKINNGLYASAYTWQRGTNVLTQLYKHIPVPKDLFDKELAVQQDEQGRLYATELVTDATNSSSARQLVRVGADGKQALGTSISSAYNVSSPVLIGSHVYLVVGASMTNDAIRQQADLVRMPM